MQKENFHKSQTPTKTLTMGGKLSSEDDQTPASPGGETESVVPPPSSSTGNEFVDLLGPTLLTKEGEKPTAEVLAGKKHVMLYFSGT